MKKTGILFVFRYLAKQKIRVASLHLATGYRDPLMSSSVVKSKSKAAVEIPYELPW